MMEPRILLATTCCFPWVAQLALALRNGGCHVLAIYPAYGHPLAKLSLNGAPFLYNPWAPRRSLKQAIVQAQADIVVPCDDRAVAHLHLLHATASDNTDLRRCIERSLGDPAGFPTTLARHSLLMLARNAGVATPDTAPLHSSKDLTAWLAVHQLPLVLKVDGTWGGKGVRVARTTADAWRAYRELRRRLPIGIALKRWVIDRDSFWIAEWLQQNSPLLSIQSYIPGRPANCAVFCWEGRVLASVAVEVMQTKETNGPATIVRVVERPEMLRAARALARHLSMSGLFGLDFMIDEVTNVAQLVEMNPRATPLCHIQLGPGRDLPGSLAASMLGVSQPRSKTITENAMIAYFPDASYVPENSMLAGTYYDIPWEVPELLEELLWHPRQERGLRGHLSRIVMRKKRKSVLRL
jgi:hypothetical protein